MTSEPRFVVCIRNDDYEIDLALHKIHAVLPDPVADGSGWIRIVDETGEDYLFPSRSSSPSTYPSRSRRSCCAPPDGIREAT